MKIPNIILLSIGLLTFFLCTTEKNLFKESKWWTWHWQNVSDTSHFFSVGSVKIGPRQIATPQFFFATRDTILSDFYMERLEDFDHKKKWKLIYTNEGQYLKIQELTDTTIEVFGPVEKQEDLPMKSGIYERLSDFATPPFPDSILYGEK